MGFRAAETWTGFHFGHLWLLGGDKAAQTSPSLRARVHAACGVAPEREPMKVPGSYQVSKGAISSHRPLPWNYEL